MSTDTRSPGASLERALRHWRERGVLLEVPPPPATKPRLVVAISRERGAGGGEIAHRIAERLQWPVYDRELVEKISADAGIRQQLLDDLDEKRPSWLSECFEGFSHEKHMSGAGFAVRLRKVLTALYWHGECVILGRGAAQILPAERTLRIRLIAPLPDRIQAVAQRTNSDEKHAQQQVIRDDKNRDDFVKSYFQADARRSDGYDIIVNTARFSIPATTELILSALAGRRERLAQKQSGA